jgi:predicted nucleotidyltransferase
MGRSPRAEQHGATRSASLREKRMVALFPTPYQDVNQIVDLLLARVKAILGDELIGMYLHGSLANGGFDEYSDIDVIFVTKGKLGDGLFSTLQALHADLARIHSPWAVQQEVSYIPQEALRRFDRSNMLHPHLDRGRAETLHWMDHESDWVIQRYILRERGIRIMGPEPRTLVDPVSPDDLRAAVAEGMPLWLIPMLKDPSELKQRGPQSFYVLSLCRMLYTLRYGAVLSKQDAARWALENMDPHWRPLIERARIGRQTPDLDSQPKDIQETLDMMRYTLEQIQPTPYLEVNEVLKSLLASLKRILGEKFVGLYLYGSLATGDFHPRSSDLDFLVVTENDLSAEMISALETMHHTLWESNLEWAAKLEGAYVPKELIRRHALDGAPCPIVNEGRLYLARLGSDWIIQRHVVRESCKTVEGPDPKPLIDPVSPEEIRSAVRGTLEEWWFPMLEDPSWLASRGSEYHAYAILTMCRALHALEHGTILSKTVAVRWAQRKLGEEWHAVLEQALVAQKPGDGSRDLLHEALRLIRYTRNTVNQ